MKLSQFNYHLDPKFIAKYPAEYRDESKLLVLHKKSGKIEHIIFKDILQYFNPKDLFILNDTKVFPARLLGKKEKTEADIVVTLLRELNREQKLWDILVDPARKVRIGNKLFFGEEQSGNQYLIAEIIDNTTSRGRTLRFLYDGTYEEFKAALNSLGQMPIPKWIRPHAEVSDKERYQTIFAKNEGAVAVPSAGIHFSRELLKRMDIKGINRAYITLHMGRGNFSDVDVEDLSKHKTDSERMLIDQECVEIVNRTKEEGGKIVAVGVTVTRATESSVTTKGNLIPYEGWTNKFIFPPYNFSIADALVSSFHLPKSIMLMSVAAFGGYENVMKAYQVALKEGYKVGPYGDAMLIL
ncbi:MAG: tRNA preQ1(34) S-adenosylmethionine ribosyltransferase-isomerase QueA [Bacteroidales bacterium]